MCGETSRPATLPREASVFSAEQYALKLVILIAITDRTFKSVVFSESLSGLTQLETWHYEHRAQRKMQHDLFTMSMTGQAVEFGWILDHAGIRGIELADFRSQLASAHQDQFITIHYRDGVQRARSGSTCFIKPFLPSSKLTN